MVVENVVISCDLLSILSIFDTANNGNRLNYLRGVVVICFQF